MNDKNNKIIQFPWSLFVMLLLLAFMFMGLSTLQNSTDKYSIRTVVIDAGHGGKDDGASGPTGVKEKNVALSVAMKLGEKISTAYPDIRVIYTRKTDVFIELFERANIANRNKADLFISIHLNSSSNPDAYGCEAWVLGLHKSESNLEVAKRENAVIKLEDNNENNYDIDPNSEAGHIIMSMAQSAYMNQSIDLAGKVVDQFEHHAQRKVRGVKQAGFMVLYKTAMPSTLIEIGFVSNPAEERYLSSGEGQNAIAGSIFNAFKGYKTGKTEHMPENIEMKTSDEKKELNIQINAESKGNEDTHGNTEHKNTSNTQSNTNTTAVKDNTTTHTIKENTSTTTGTLVKEEQIPVQTSATLFRIQFYAAATKAKTGDKFDNAFGKNIVYEDNGKGIFRYMIGAYTSYAEARQQLSGIKAKGFADAFIVVYEKGVRGDIRKYQ